MTTGQRKGVDLGKNLISALCFLKLQISEVMANSHWDDFFSCFVTFPRIGKDIDKKRGATLNHTTETRKSILPRLLQLGGGIFCLGLSFNPIGVKKPKIFGESGI